MPQDEPPDETSGQEAPDDGFGLLQGPIPWARRLTRRAKFFRIVVLVGLALVTVGIIAGSSLVAQLFPQAGGSKTLSAPSGLRNALPFPTFPAMSLRATLPPSAYTTPISQIHVAPGYSSNPFISSAWVCWVTEPLVRSPGSASVLHVARTLDGGQTWRELAPTITSASGCQIAADHENFSSALLVADSSDDGTGPCSARLLLTQNDGDSWRSIPAPQAYATDCAAGYSLFGDTIFASGDENTAAPPQLAEVWRIGASSTWTVASAGSGLIVTAVVGQRSDGRLLGAAAFSDPHAGPGSIIESADGGATWNQIGALPGANAALYIDERAPQAHAATEPIYAISNKAPQTTQGIPAKVLWRWNDERRQWVALPDIPRLVNVPDPLAQPDTTVVGVGPDGGLLVSAPISASVNEEPASRSFWYWEDTAQRWIRNDAASAPGAYLYGLGWSGNAATLWLIYLHLGVPPHLEMFTTRFSADSFSPK
ncbi:MAG TPA: hypothetical protein VHR15_17080 [Ktedonobacterales bacterium]|nr:hypothetical protein [Ktedonobacterales bacterium]